MVRGSGGHILTGLYGSSRRRLRDRANGSGTTLRRRKSSWESHSSEQPSVQSGGYPSSQRTLPFRARPGRDNHPALHHGSEEDQGHNVAGRHFVLGSVTRRRQDGRTGSNRCATRSTPPASRGRG